MGSHSDKFLDEAVEFWQPRVARKLTQEDGRQITENLSGFFKILLDWDATERQKSRTKGIKASIDELPISSVQSKLV